MTHPGVGHVTALATEVFLGDPSRFTDGKALASYVGMIPSEYSSGRRQRLGARRQVPPDLSRHPRGAALVPVAAGARPASSCPGSTDSSPARMISHMYAASFSDSAMNAARNGSGLKPSANVTSSTPPRTRPLAFG